MKFTNKIFLTIALSMLAAAELEGVRGRGHRRTMGEESNARSSQEAPQGANAASSSDAPSSAEQKPFSRVEELEALRASFSRPAGGHSHSSKDQETAAPAPDLLEPAHSASIDDPSRRSANSAHSSNYQIAAQLVDNLVGSSDDYAATSKITRGGLLTRPNGNRTPELSPRSNHSEDSGVVVSNVAPVEHIEGVDGSSLSLAAADASLSARASRNSTDSDATQVEEFRAEVVSAVNASASSSALSSIAGNGKTPVQLETHTALTSAASASAAASSSDTGAGTGALEPSEAAGINTSSHDATAAFMRFHGEISNPSREATDAIDLFTEITRAIRYSKGENYAIEFVAKIPSNPIGYAIDALFTYNKATFFHILNSSRSVDDAFRSIARTALSGISEEERNSLIQDSNCPIWLREYFKKEDERSTDVVNERDDVKTNNETSQSIITTRNVAIAAVVIAAAGGAYYYRNEIKAGAKKAYDKSKLGINWLLGKEDELKKQQEAFNKANEEQKNKNRSWFGFGK